MVQHKLMCDLHGGEKKRALVCQGVSPAAGEASDVKKLKNKKN